MRIATAGLPRFLLMTSTALLAPASIAMAQDAAPQASADQGGGNVIIVTAQKRSENLQNVPISIQALGTQKLDQLNVSNFNGYTQQLPTVVAQSSGTPGTNIIYMRGVASGGDGNHSGSLPSVGVYLDEQPVTTIGASLVAWVAASVVPAARIVTVWPEKCAIRPLPASRVATASASDIVPCSGGAIRPFTACAGA